MKMRPRHNLELSIVQPAGERGFRVTLSGASPGIEGGVVMGEERKVEFFGQALKEAAEMLAEFLRRAQ